MSRKAGPLEIYNICRYHHGLYTNFTVLAGFNKDVTKNILSVALHKIILKEPVLTYGVKINEPNIPKIEQKCQDVDVAPVPIIRFDDVVEFVDEPFSESKLRAINEIVISMDANKVTWKILVFSNNYVSFVNNHVYMDGGASGFFLEDLCEALQESDDNEFQQVLYSGPGPTQLEPDVTKLTDLYRNSIVEKFAAVVKELTPGFISKWFTAYTMPDYVNYEPFVSKHKGILDNEFKLIHIPNDKLQQLLTVCRRNKVTFTAFLDIAVRYVLNQLILKLGNFSLKSETVLSGRRFFPELQDKLRYNYVVTADIHTLPPVKELLIKAMKAVLNAIKTDLQTRAPFKLFGLIELIGAYALIDPASRSPGRPIYNAFEISNLGSTPPSSGDWQITDVVFSQCTGRNITFGINVSSCITGTNIVVGFPIDYNGEDWDQFESLLLKSIDDFIAT